jgi:bifunctional non-homologous end joining protein LigD
MATSSFPSSLVPIHPQLAKPFHRDGWIFEEKYDGWRMVAYKQGRHVRLVSRRNVDHTKRFAELAAALARLPARTLILDGEVCAFDEALVSHMHLLMDPPADTVVTPPTFIAFDALYSRGRDIRSWPLKDRRKMMEDEIDGSSILPARRLPDDGLEAWTLVQARGYEGLIAKDAMAPYGPTTRWWKVKVRHEARVVVGGLVVAQTGYHGLLVGARIGRELRYLGCVEWGVGRRTVEAVIQRGRRRADSPFTDLRRRSGVVWLEPRLTAEVTFSEIVQGRLRARPSSPRQKKRPFRYRKWRKHLRALPSDAHNGLENFHTRMHVAVLKHMVTGSPLLICVVLLFGAVQLVRGAIRRLGGLRRLLEAFAAHFPGVDSGLELIEYQARRARLEETNRRRRAGRRVKWQLLALIRK